MQKRVVLIALLLTSCWLFMGAGKASAFGMGVGSWDLPDNVVLTRGGVVTTRFLIGVHSPYYPSESMTCYGGPTSRDPVYGSLFMSWVSVSPSNLEFDLTQGPGVYWYVYVRIEVPLDAPLVTIGMGGAEVWCHSAAFPYYWAGGGNMAYTWTIQSMLHAEADGPYLGYEGAPVTLDASNSYIPGGGLLEYRWDIDSDGDWDTGWSESPFLEKVWEDDFVGDVVLEVADGSSTDLDTAEVTVLNVAPTVEAGPDLVVTVGEVVDFAGAFYDPGWTDSHTLSWDFGDGTATDGTLTPAHVYRGEGLYRVTLGVTDDDGGQGTDTLLVTVRPLAALIDIEPNSLNLRNLGQWITCYIELPEGYDPGEIDAGTVILSNPMAVVLDSGYGFVRSKDSYVVDYDGDGIMERLLKFGLFDENRSGYVRNLLPPGTYSLYVHGYMVDGTPFEGYSDRIRVFG